MLQLLAIVFVIILIAAVVFLFIGFAALSLAWKVVYLIGIVLLISVVIWLIRKLLRRV